MRKKEKGERERKIETGKMRESDNESMVLRVLVRKKERKKERGELRE